MAKQRIALLCGGQSVEHEISLISASNIFRGLGDDYDVSVF